MDYECYRALFERSLSVLPPIERRVFMKRMMQGKRSVKAVLSA